MPLRNPNEPHDPDETWMPEELADDAIKTPPSKPKRPPIRIIPASEYKPDPKRSAWRQWGRMTAETWTPGFDFD